MKKLIKLLDTHYIVVDDSEMKDVRPYIGKFHLEKGSIINQFPNYLTDLSECKLITHSTQPLEPSLRSDDNTLKDFVFIKPLSLAEVEEAINGYNVEKMAENLWLDSNSQLTSKKSFIQGFKAHQELVKDKLFTVEDIKKAFEEGVDSQFMTVSMDVYEVRENYRKTRLRTFIQSLLPKTEWDVEFVDGKLKLI